MKEFCTERQVDLEVELEAGEYVILPRTSGCSFNKIHNDPEEQVPLLDSNGDLSILAQVAVNDVFRRLDNI